MKRIGFLIFAAAVSGLLMVSCEKDPLEDRMQRDEMLMDNDLSRLSRRVSIIEGGRLMPVVPLAREGDLKSLKSESMEPRYEIYLRAEVDPPVYEGKTLQASHIKVVGNNAFVTYNRQGPEYLGGVDVFDVSDIENPVLIQSVIFPEKDISSIDVDAQGTGNNNFIYLTGAYNPEYDQLGLSSPAVVERFNANKSNMFMHLEDPRQYKDLPGFAGNDVRFNHSGNQVVYVTSGSDGGLTILNHGMQFIRYESIPYARSIDTDGERLVVYSAEDNRLIVMNMDGNIEREITTGGEHFIDGQYLEAKSIVRLKGNLAFVAAGTGGMEVYDISSGAMVGSLPRPAEHEDAEIPLNYVTNGVSVNDDFILVANGGSGVHISTLDGDDGIRSLGRFMFEYGSSANFIEARENKIFVATGKGGLKILELVKVETCIVSVKYPSSGSPAYFPEVYVTEAGVYNGTYPGWCAQSTVPIEQFTEYPAEIFSSLDNLTGKNVVEQPENLDKVNWILNQEFVGRESDAGGKFIFGDVQHAIWDLISVLPPLVSSPHDPERVNEILSLAGIHGPEFELQCGHVYAIIFVIDDAQNVIIEYPYPCED